MTRIAKDRAGNVIQAIRPGTTSETAFNAVSATISVSKPGNDQILYRLVATAACHVEINATPTATVNSMYLPAEVIEFVWFRPTDNIAVVQNLVDGTLFITEGSQ